MKLKIYTQTNGEQEYEVKFVHNGHVNEDTALTVKNYPYSFNLRTEIRYWIESVKNKGQRFCSQTLNPKTNLWNKPKKSTYQFLSFIVELENTYIEHVGISHYVNFEQMEKIDDLMFLNAMQPNELKAFYTLFLYSKNKNPESYQIYLNRGGKKNWNIETFQVKSDNRL